MQVSPFGTYAAATRAKPPPEGTDPRLVPPVPVSAARRLPDYNKPHGWRMKKELRRVESSKALIIVPYREYREMSRRYPGRASVHARQIRVAIRERLT